MLQSAGYQRPAMMFSLIGLQQPWCAQCHSHGASRFRLRFSRNGPL